MKTGHNQINKNTFLKNKRKNKGNIHKEEEKCYSTVMILLLATPTNINLNDPRTIYAIYAMELSIEELISDIGMETSYGGTLEILYNILYVGGGLHQLPISSSLGLDQQLAGAGSMITLYDFM